MCPEGRYIQFVPIVEARYFHTLESLKSFRLSQTLVWNDCSSLPDRSGVIQSGFLWFRHEFQVWLCADHSNIFTRAAVSLMLPPLYFTFLHHAIGSPLGCFYDHDQICWSLKTRIFNNLWMIVITWSDFWCTVFSVAVIPYLFPSFC